MISDDERREVAGDLRDMAIRPYIRYKEQFFDELAETVVGFEDFHDFNVVLEKLADLIAPRGKDALAAEVNEKVDMLTRERDEAVAEVASLRERAERAEAELDGLRKRLAEVGFLLRDEEEGEDDD